jgi:hypothetical protein
VSDDQKRKVWVLDTETKGTGAEMVPLETRAAAAGRGALVVKPPKPAAEPPAVKRRPHRFKVVDVLTRQTLIEDADLRATLELMRGLRSVVDIDVFARVEEGDDWRHLSQHERRLLWERRGTGASHNQ